MAAVHPPVPLDLQRMEKIDVNEIKASTAFETEESIIEALETLPQDAGFYQGEKESDSQTEANQKRGLFGRIGRSLWGKSKSEKTNEKEAVAAVLACRSPAASVNGGIAIQDPNHAKLCRSVLALMIRQMGKNLLKGANVMNVSFPIQCCQPTTILEVAALQAGYFHQFLPSAAAAKDPVERMKYVVAAMVSAMTLTSGNFLKPLNPALGETLQVQYDDGSRAFMEQTCHHPPVSSFSYEGPGRAYSYHGYTTFDIGFGYNKMHIRTSGLRVLEFADGGRVSIGFPQDRWGNVFWGEMHHESLGGLDFLDEANGVRCTIRFAPEGGFKSMPSDYFEGVIERVDGPDPAAEGTPVCAVTGSWVGFCDFDKVRYWDIRTSAKMGPAAAAAGLMLPSDSTLRPDRRLLIAADYKAAQAAKVQLEEEQRRDRRLRQDAQAPAAKK